MPPFSGMPEELAEETKKEYKIEINSGVNVGTIVKIRIPIL